MTSLERLPLTTAWLGRRHLHLATCASTNDRAAAEGRAGAAEGLLVTTDAQTAGRGRLGRTWHAPAGENLAFSLLLRPARPPVEIPPLTLMAGAAVAGALRELGFDARVKWPNDVLLGGQKVCGILVERVHVRAHGSEKPLAVVGIGLNVDQTGEELPVPTATSLALAGDPRDRTRLLGEVLTRLAEAIDVAARSPAAFVDIFRPLCDTLGRIVRVDLPGGAELTGLAVEIDDHGRLVVEDDDGRTPVAAGDVVHVRAAG